MKRGMFFGLLSLLAFAGKAQEMPRNYLCYRAPVTVKVDGKMSSEEWDKAPWTETFVDIEGDKRPLPKFKTRAKMLWDDDYFYVAAELEEPHIWGKLTQRDAVIFHDNDFEVFIDPQGDNHQYYEFEMNALNTVWDLMIIKPYRDGAPAVNGWHISGLQSGVEIFGTVNNPNDVDKKWTVEIAFPWSILKECAPGQRKPNGGEQWRVNFSRVNWDMEVKDDQYVKPINPQTGKHYPEYNWVWSPQGVIAMHQPETWGYVQFSDLLAGEGQEKFVVDTDYPLKKVLIEVYKQQKSYFERKGKYTLQLKNIPAQWRKKISIEITKKQFLAYGKGASGKVWYIDQESKIWSEK
ncbi:MAG: carbohydrate-binding family 9-like protein [Marinifilaceae bacterium]|jgi:hypothetical protein